MACRFTPSSRATTTPPLAAPGATRPTPMAAWLATTSAVVATITPARSCRSRQPTTSCTTSQSHIWPSLCSASHRARCCCASAVVRPTSAATTLPWPTSLARPWLSPAPATRAKTSTGVSGPMRRQRSHRPSSRTEVRPLRFCRRPPALMRSRTQSPRALR